MKYAVVNTATDCKQYSLESITPKDREYQRKVYFVLLVEIKSLHRGILI